MKIDPMLAASRLKELLHYDPDTGLFTWLPVVRRSRSKPGSVAGSVTIYGYLQIKIDQRKWFAHRLAWLYMTGEWPSVEIDHINRVRVDNRFQNLRLASRKQNQENRTARVRGVRFESDRGKWLARIKHNQRTINLGRFDTHDQAVAARKKAERELFTHSEACAQ